MRARLKNCAASYIHWWHIYSRQPGASLNQNPYSFLGNLAAVCQINWFQMRATFGNDLKDSWVTHEFAQFWDYSCNLRWAALSSWLLRFVTCKCSLVRFFHMLRFRLLTLDRRFAHNQRSVLSFCFTQPNDKSTECHRDFCWATCLHSLQTRPTLQQKGTFIQDAFDGPPQRQFAKCKSERTCTEMEWIPLRQLLFQRSNKVSLEVSSHPTRLSWQCPTAQQVFVCWSSRRNSTASFFCFGPPFWNLKCFFFATSHASKIISLEKILSHLHWRWERDPSKDGNKMLATTDGISLGVACQLVAHSARGGTLWRECHINRGGTSVVRGWQRGAAQKDLQADGSYKSHPAKFFPPHHGGELESRSKLESRSNLETWNPIRFLLPPKQLVQSLNPNHLMAIPLPVDCQTWTKSVFRDLVVFPKFPFLSSFVWT